MKSTYTYVHNYGNRIFSRGYHDNGERFSIKEEFSPVLFIDANKNKKPSEWTDLFGKTVYPIEMGSIREAKDFLERYKEVQGFNVTGMTNWVTQYISEKFPGELKLNMRYTRVNFLDIETATEGGFPNIELANEEVLLITVYDNILCRYVVYTSRDLTKSSRFQQILRENSINPEDVVISKHNDEYHLLKHFCMDWNNACPDIITGWNICFFDVPYLVNRIKRILGDSFVEQLSPWGLVRERYVKMNNDEELTYDIIGVNQLDYIDLMKKYTYGGRDSWKLDNVANDELGRKKLAFDGSFKEHYTQDYEHFSAYNVIDVGLVKALEDKMKLIELALTIAYDSKVNPDEVFSQIRSWDSLIYNYLKEKKIVIPNNERKNRQVFEGAYVKDPIIGKHKWVVSFDLQSLYPHIMMWANISPETMSSYVKNVSVEGLLEKKHDLEDLKEQNLSMTANGVCYNKDKQGFIPELMDKFYADRSKYKKQMLALEQEYSNTKNEDLIPEISRLNNLQMARKIAINSVYGAMGSPYFRYYDLRMAEGITTSGQLAIRWVSQHLNDYMNKACKTKGVDYCIYNDTDSSYFTLEKFVDMHFKDKPTEELVKIIDKFAGDVLQKVINKSYDELADYMNAFSQKLIMKREVIADIGLFIAKKKYALNVHNSEGVQYKEPKIKAVGLELVRSSTPAPIREALKDGVRQVLHGTEKSVQKFIADYKNVYMKENPFNIARPSGVNGMKQYAGSPIYTKGTPIHVRAALLYNHYVKKHGLQDRYEPIKDGGKMKFLYLRMPNPIREDVIGFPDKLPPEFGLESFIDWETMWEKNFISPMQIMLDPLNWSAVENSSLEDFFG